MIGVDVSPLVCGPPRGVARALWHLLDVWTRHPPAFELLLCAPGPLPASVPQPGELLTPKRPVSSARRFRRRLRERLAGRDMRAWYSPYSAFPSLRVPVVACVHELPFVRLGPIEGRARSWRHRWWLRRNVGECAGIVVPSEATREDLLTLHPGAAPRVHVVPNGFDAAPFARLPRVSDLPGERLLLIGAGGPAWRCWKKGVDVALAALDLLPDATLVLAGEPGGEPSHPRVEYHACPSDDALKALLASATVLVHPARSEGFGYPPLEGMAAGVPVVVSDGGALPEVVGEGAEIVPAGDAEALAAAVRRLGTDDTRRARRRAAGALRAGAFDPHDSARALAELLNSVGARS